MSFSLKNPICLALDSRDPDRVATLASATQDHVGMFKVGLTAFVSFGSYLSSSLAAQRPVFLDLKLHDIPAQVSGAIRAVADTGASLVTIHASGGAEMVKAAADAAGDVTILAVTILTSLDDPGLSEIGMTPPAEKAVLTLAELALSNGAHGLVCSALEVEAIRARFGPHDRGGPLLVVPGIRPSGSDVGDQRRTMTPREALAAGADVLVIGRPITEAPDPAEAARRIVEEIS
ncbi:MAG: orotidine-5'-phosphate decarboxylase [Actinomycetota bacterium]